MFYNIHHYKVKACYGITLRCGCIIKAHTKNRIWLTKLGNIVFREKKEDTAVKYNDLLDQTFVGPGRLTEVL
jgi:hypothetical protein